MTWWCSVRLVGKRWNRFSSTIARIIMIKKGQIIELNIEKMAFGGQGIGFLHGLVVFVRNTAPGDKITARIFKRKKDYCEAQLTEVITPSPYRVIPPCQYTGICGGCQWQHVSYEKQLALKLDLISEAMTRIGGFQKIHIRDILPSDDIFGYRNKMEFSFADRPWVPNPEEIPEAKTKGFALGLHIPGTFNKVLDIDACLLQHEQGNSILREVKAFSRQSGLPCYNLKTHEGFWRFLVLRYSQDKNQWMINIVTSEKRTDFLTSLSNHLLNRFHNIATIINNITKRKAGIAVGESEWVVHGPGFIFDKIGTYSFQISANSFFQTNTKSAKKLYDTVVEFSELKGKEVVLDLYSGTGTIPIYMAEKCKKVVGIEIVESAVTDAHRNVRINKINNVEFLLGDIKENLPLVKEKPDVMIIDPPRSGVHKKVLKQILDVKPMRIIYVSCNPSTLARDLRRLAEGYHIEEIQPVDMFPNTYHVESVTKLKLKGKKS